MPRGRMSSPKGHGETMIAGILRRGAPVLGGVALVAGILGCARLTSPDGLVEVTTDRAEYVAGQSGRATITNVSDEVVHYNTCPRTVERRTGVEWKVEARWPQPGGACAMIAYALAPGGSAEVPFELPQGLPEGTYRVRFFGFSDDDGDRPRNAASRPFLVEQPVAMLHTAR